MAFFRNSAINLLNLHYGIHAVALRGGEAFFLIYLLKAGIPIPGVLLAFAAILLGRFLFRPLIAVAAVRCGVRALVVAGTALSALTYPLLAEVHGVGSALAALIALDAVASTLYWTSYHAYFARLGDDEHRGQQVGVREAIVALVGIVSPLLTGWMLVALGPRAAFGASGVVTALSILPLLWAPAVAVPRQVPPMLRTALPAVLLFAADGWVAAGNVFVWRIGLFVSLHENYLGYGSALALAALAAAAGGMTLGRHIDAGHGRRAVWVALGVVALMVTLRAAAVGHATLAVLASALGSLAYCLYIPTVMTPVYTMAKRSPCTLRFQVAAEGGWDLGCAAAIVLGTLTIERGLPLSAAILLALPGVMALTGMLRRYYAQAPAAAVASPGAAVAPCKGKSSIG